MAATRDFIHDEAIIDAVIDQLEAHLPAAWLLKEVPPFGVKEVVFGDWRYFDFPPEENLAERCPVIFAWCNRTQDATAIYGGLGGKEGWTSPVRVVHIWTLDQCKDGTTDTKDIQPQRSQCQRAKVLMKALMTDRSLGDSVESPILTTSDTSARIIECRPVGLTYDVPNLPAGVVGLMIDLAVHTRTQ